MSNAESQTGCTAILGGCVPWVWDDVIEHSTLKKRKEHIEYVFRVRDGPPFTEQELDDLERLLAAMIVQNLGYKKKTTNIPKEEGKV